MQACGSAGEIIIIHKGITLMNTVSLHKQMSHGQRRTCRLSYTLNDRFSVMLHSQPRATSVHCMNANHFLKYRGSIFFVFLKNLKNLTELDTVVWCKSHTYCSKQCSCLSIGRWNHVRIPSSMCVTNQSKMFILMITQCRAVAIFL